MFYWFFFLIRLAEQNRVSPCRRRVVPDYYYVFWLIAEACLPTGRITLPVSILVMIIVTT
jgi:hypothetical protein